MTRPVDRERLEQIEREAREPEPPIPFPEPAVLAMQRTAGNQAVTRFLQRQPNLTITDHRAVASERVLTWFAAVAREVRQTEPGTPLQSVPELVYMAGELDLQDEPGKVRERMKPSAIEDLIRRSAREQGIELLEHRDLADVRGVAAEATAILGNLGRIPTELKFGSDSANITISLGGKVNAKLGDVEAHGSSEGGGASIKTQGGSKVGFEIGKSIKIDVKAGDLVTVKGSLTPEGDGRVSWSAQISIGTLGGNVVTADDVAKVMSAAQTAFGESGAAMLDDASVENVTKHGPALKKAVTDVADRARKSAGQAKPGWSVGATVKGDKTGGYSGTVTVTWVF